MRVKTKGPDGERLHYATSQVRPSLQKKVKQLGYTLQVVISRDHADLKSRKGLDIYVNSTLWKFYRRIDGYSLKKLDQAIQGVIAEIEEGAFTTISAREHITYKKLLKNMIDKFDIPTIYTWLDEVLEETQ